MRALCVAALVLATAAPSLAHQFGKSFSNVEASSSGVSVVVDLDPDDLEETLRGRFDDDGSGQLSPREMEAHLEQVATLVRLGYVVTRGEARCTPKLGARRVSPEARMVRVHLALTCPEGLLAIELPLLDRMNPGHVHLATLHLPEGVQGVALTAAEPRYAQHGEATAFGFFRLGVEHILTGYDHLLFLCALLLVAGSLRELLLIVTSFTLAHSITLICAALGVVSLPPSIVEPAIALSIVYVAAENLWRRAPTHRALLTFVLGLIHGFGFASVLAETGLPPDGRVLPLLAFNVGVEAGQLGVVLLVSPMMRWAANRPRVGPRLVRYGSLAVGFCGVVWFVSRVVGLV